MKTQTLLRSLVFTFCFSIFSLSAYSQWVSIPDTNFGKWLNTTYSGCMQGNSQTGWQLDITCSSVINATSISCVGKSIRNLSGVHYFVRLRSLNCSVNLLTSFPQLPDSLTSLTFSSNKFTSFSFAGLPTSLTSVDCSGNLITNIGAIPANLVTLFCGNNLLTALPSFAGNLKNLFCANNQITSISNMGGLETLDCSYNQITSIGSISSTLYTLKCHHNLLTSLPNFRNLTTEVDCSFNQLTSLPALTGNMTWLYCSNNLLDTLPALSPLLVFDCSYNQLTTLPSIPSTIRDLYCSGNQLTSIPQIPSGNFRFLECDSNQLTSLPALPSIMTRLSCTHNQLTGTLNVPNVVPDLRCNNNQLNDISSLPNSVTTFHCQNNPNLNCLPKLKAIANLNFSNTNITCLPNYGNVVNSTPLLSAVPLCDIFNNSNGCDILWNISGNTYYDADNNCLNGVGDTIQQNVKIQLWRGSSLLQQTLTGSESLYSFDVDSLDNYELRVDTSNTPFYVSCPVNGVWFDTLIVVDSLHYNRDFALECKPGFDLTAQSIWGWGFRPANFSRVQINAGDITNFYGVHCAAGVSGAVTVTINGPASYFSPAAGARTPTGIIGNDIVYAVSDFGTVNFTQDFNIMVQTDTTAPLGSQVCFTVSVTPTAGDNNPANNVLTHCFTVVGSYDPNDKTVYPAGDIDTAQEWLTYTVRFQNTGTAEAQHIYITDTLDSDLDVSSFQLLAYSHPPMVQLKENAVRFNFPNINLPDSNTNEPLSHGYVQYKIKLKDNLPIGTTINNTAFIYFDFNAPVVTNTTTNTIAVISGIAASHEPMAVRIYPNPASSAVTISVDERLIGATATITDVAGRTIVMLNIDHRISNIKVGELANGVYFVRVTDKEGRSIAKKLVVNK